jgi:hypothetical protein
MIRARRLALAIIEAIVSAPACILERYFGLESDCTECHECSTYEDSALDRLVVHGHAFCHQCDRDHVDGELCNRQIERFCLGCRKWRCLTRALLCPINSEHAWHEALRRPMARMSPPSMMSWARIKRGGANEHS